MTAHVSMLLNSRAPLTCFRACFLPGRAKGLSNPQAPTAVGVYWSAFGVKTAPCPSATSLTYLLSPSALLLGVSYFWAPEPVCRRRRREKSLLCPETVHLPGQSVALLAGLLQLKIYRLNTRHHERQVLLA